MPLIDSLSLLPELLLFSYLFFISIYSLVLAVAGLISPVYRKANTDISRKIAVFIPAYKEDDVICDAAANVLLQNYPNDLFDIFVIADLLKDSTIAQLKALQVNVISVRFELSTKVRALNAAFDHVKERYDLCVILDADNFAEQDFLAISNRYFNAGYLSIQGQRKPKNTDTKMALLDGLSESINNHIVRKGTCVLGGSSAIVGSGFAVAYDLLKDILSSMNAVGGFDKELEIKLLQKGVKTIFVKEAVIYDEKVQDQEVFKKQRTRWIYSQFYYLRKYFSTGIKAFFNGNFALFNSAFLRYAQLPRLLNIGVFVIAIVVLYFLKDYLILPFAGYFLLFIFFVISVLLAIPRSMYTFDLLKAGFELPLTFLNMALIMFRLKGSNKKFIHTPHKVKK